MKITTFNLGELEVPEDQVIYFEHGIPGFEQLKKYIIVRTDKDSLFCNLQSVDDGDVSFIITNPFLFFPQYEFELPDSVLAELSIKQTQDVEAWAIVIFKESIEETTINLMAPLIINSKENLGKQVVLHDSAYQTKHQLFQQTPETAGTKE